MTAGTMPKGGAGVGFEACGRIDLAGPGGILRAMLRPCPYCDAGLIAGPERDRVSYACTAPHCPGRIAFAVSQAEETARNGFWTLPKEQQALRLKTARMQAAPGSVPLVKS